MKYRRTTVLLENEVYDALVAESARRYRNTKSISKIINEMLKTSFTSRKKLVDLLYTKKVAHVTQKEFEKFRHELSKSAEKW